MTDPAQIHEALAAAGHRIRNVRVLPGGAVQVALVEGATAQETAAAQAAADAWRPTAADKISAAARKRGLTVPQLAAARAVAALAAGQTAPLWARTILAAEATRIDADVS